MCHVDCVKTVQSGQVVEAPSLISTVHTVCQSEWDCRHPH